PPSPSGQDGPRSRTSACSFSVPRARSWRKPREPRPSPCTCPTPSRRAGPATTRHSSEQERNLPKLIAWRGLLCMAYIGVCRDLRRVSLTLICTTRWEDLVSQSVNWLHERCTGEHAEVGVPRHARSGLCRRLPGEWPHTQLPSAAWTQTASPGLTARIGASRAPQDLGRSLTLLSTSIASGEPDARGRRHPSVGVRTLVRDSGVYFAGVG
ncbi:MAG: hypothetical protein QOF60_2683, partial [Actinomycetota bacterium]|nr:hypothetical protein [Actinomycetota bacterium]